MSEIVTFPVRPSSRTRSGSLMGAWGRTLYWLTMLAARLAGRLMFQLQINGRENIPRGGPLLIISNHLSHLDPPLVATAFARPVYYMAKSDLFKVPLLRAILRTVKTILVERGKARQSILFVKQ